MFYRKLTRYVPHPLVTASFITAFTFYLLYGLPLFDDPDMPWHIAAGEWMLNHHTIPLHDPFSYTSGKVVWYNISWLWDVGLGEATFRFGLQGAQIMGVTAAAFALALLCYCLQKRGIVEDPILVTLFLTGIVLWNFPLARPQVMSCAFIVIFHLVLHQSREHRRGIYLLLLPLIMVLWVNIHGAFLVGITLLGAYGIEAWHGKRWRWFRYLLVCGVLSGAAIFINPYGFGIIIATLRTLHSVITDYISEWHPFTYGTFLPFTLYVLAIFMLSNPRDKDVPLADKILTFFWLVMALNSIRNFAILAFIAAPYMAMNMQKAMVLHYHPDVSSLKPRLKMAGFAIAVVAVLLLPPMQRFLDQNEQPLRMVPLEEMAFIQQHYPDKRFINDYDLGGYMMYYTKDASKLFVDGRAGTAYSEALLAEYLRFLTLEPGFETVFDRYNIEGIMVKNSHPFIAYYNNAKAKGWKKMFSGKVATVYVRDKISQQSLDSDLH